MKIILGKFWPGILIATVSLLVSAPAGRSVPHPSEWANSDSRTRSQILRSIGLNREAEKELRASLTSDEIWARVPLLQLLLERGELTEAGRLIDEWDAPVEEWPRDAVFSAARVREAQKRHDDAARLYDASVVREPLLADYASYRAGQAHQAGGALEEAITRYEAAGASAKSAALAARAHWKAAAVAQEIEDLDRALANLERIPARSVIARKDLLELEAKIYRAKGETRREARVLRELFDRAPSSEVAVAAVHRLAELESPTVEDRVSFAETALKNRHPALAEAQARQALAALTPGERPVLEGKARLALGKAMIKRRLLTKGRQELALMPEKADRADRGEALLDRARCLWRLGQIDACLAEYDVVMDGDYPDDLRADAGWEGGREAKDNRRWREASLRLGEFQRLFPNHDYADDALWHQGRSFVELGETEEAVKAFRMLRDRYPRSTFFEEATYWTAQLYEAEGEQALACSEFEVLLNDRPDSYWALRARDIVPSGPCSSLPIEPEVNESDPFEWLLSESGVDDQHPERLRERIEGSERYQRAAVLAAVGLIDEAEEELAGLRRGLGRDPVALVAIAKASFRIGVQRAGMSAILVLKKKTGKPILSGRIPASVARLLYPLDHADAVLRWADEYDVDPLFVYAVMREESWFDAEAVSWAGAHGLLQIMPSTGRDLARRVGLRGFDRSDLFNPEVNIRLGTFYLSSLLDDLDEEPALALSAYNAGKGNALRWRRALEGDFDVDRYVATISYRETYHYVQRVQRSWEIYQYLYGDLVPDLKALRDVGGSRP